MMEYFFILLLNMRTIKEFHITYKCLNVSILVVKTILENINPLRKVGK